MTPLMTPHVTLCGPSVTYLASNDDFVQGAWVHTEVVCPRLWSATRSYIEKTNTGDWMSSPHAWQARRGRRAVHQWTLKQRAHDALVVWPRTSALWGAVTHHLWGLGHVTAYGTLGHQYPEAFQHPPSLLLNYVSGFAWRFVRASTRYSAAQAATLGLEITKVSRWFFAGPAFAYCRSIAFLVGIGVLISSQHIEKVRFVTLRPAAAAVGATRAAGAQPKPTFVTAPAIGRISRPSTATSSLAQGVPQKLAPVQAEGAASQGALPPSEATVSTAPATTGNGTIASPLLATLTSVPAETVATVTAPAQLAPADLDISSPTSLWQRAGQAYGVDPLLIYSIALVESRQLQTDGSIAPTPWVARINDQLMTGDMDEVKREITSAQMLGMTVKDVGIMQVYYPLHKDIESDPVALLSPERNIMVGTQILRGTMQETTDPVLGIGYYHSHNPVLARYYGRAVLTVYQRLKVMFGHTQPPAEIASAG